MSDELAPRLTAEELAAEGGTPLPAKEVMSLLDLNANIDLALDTAAPIDLAIGANANIAAPINAAVDANVLSVGSQSSAESVQTGVVHQGITGDATATTDQTSSIDQGNPTTSDPVTSGGTAGGATTGSVTDGNLLNVNVNLDGNLHLASPIDGAVAANANAAAPINAGVAANIGSVDSTAVSVSHQDVAIDQNITGDATASGTQDSGISQSSGPGDTTTPAVDGSQPTGG